MTSEEFKQALAAAENGDTEAMLVVAGAYTQGDGTVENSELGMSWLQKAAAFGNKEVQESLAEAFKEGLVAAENNDAETQMGVGSAYLMGIGTDVDFKQAVFWFQRAARSKGSITTKLGAKGMLIFTEVMLPARNFRELMEGAQKGNMNFQYGLGFAYLKGFGTNIDPNQAIFWFQKAAAQGHTGAIQTLHQMQAVGEDDFDQVVPQTQTSKGLAIKHPILLGIILAAAVSYLATGLDIGWLYSLAIFSNISWIVGLPIQIIKTIIRLVSGISLIIGTKVRGAGKATMTLGYLSILLLIPIIGLSVHYIKGRKTGNPISIVLQNPFEAARKHIFSSQKASGDMLEVDPGETPIIITATVVSNAANIRSTPDSRKNNVITQIKNGGILIVTGPVENGWLPVEADGKPGYVSAELVKIDNQ